MKKNKKHQEENTSGYLLILHKIFTIFAVLCYFISTFAADNYKNQKDR